MTASVTDYSLGAPRAQPPLAWASERKGSIKAVAHPRPPIPFFLRAVPPAWPPNYPSHVSDQVRFPEVFVLGLRYRLPEIVDEVVNGFKTFALDCCLLNLSLRGKSGGSARGTSRAGSSRSSSIRADHEYLAIPNYDDEDTPSNNKPSSMFGRNVSGRIVAGASGRAASSRFGLSGRNASLRLQSVEQRRGRGRMLCLFCNCGNGIGQ